MKRNEELLICIALFFSRFIPTCTMPFLKNTSVSLGRQLSNAKGELVVPLNMESLLLIRIPMP